MADAKGQKISFPITKLQSLYCLPVYIF